MKPFSGVLFLASAAACFSGVFSTSLQMGEHHWNTGLTGRLSGKQALASARLEFAWEVTPSVGNPALSGPSAGHTEYRISDFAQRILPEEWSGTEKASLLHNLDRLNLQFRPLGIRLTAGRQAVYWGVSRAVSPTDFIAPLPWATPFTHYRVGVDGLRAVMPVGVLSEMETGAVFGEGGKGNGYWLRGRFYSLKTDLTLLGVLAENRCIAGGSLNRALGGAVGWAEGAYTAHESGEKWWGLSSGAERSFFRSRLSCYIEYHHSSAGERNSSVYTENMGKQAYMNGGVYLQGKNYLSAGASVAPGPLLTVSAACLRNADDGSLSLNLEGDRSLSGEASIRLGVSLGSGSPGSEFADTPWEIYSVWSIFF